MASRWLMLLSSAWLGLSGCVAGYGRCLFLQPSRVNLQGTVHWRSLGPAPPAVPANVAAPPKSDFAKSMDRAERIAVLSLQTSAYVYAPAQSLQCRPMRDVELEFTSDPPQSLAANARVRVHGSLYQSTSDRHRTPFVLSVETLEVLH